MDTETIEKRKHVWTEKLRDNDYRLTAARCAVIEVLAASECAITPTEIYDLARQEYEKLGLVTVYRTLEKLEDLDLVMRVHRQDNCYAFIAGFEGHQHLLVCERCGRVAYFSGDNIDDLVQRVEDESGYKVHDHWLQLFGLCAKCAQQ